MFRALPIIIAAIQLDHPRVSNVDATVYAQALQEQAQEHKFDPLTGVAIIHHESRFNARIISRDKEDYGLAQIRARFVGKCRYTESPKDNPTPACRKEKARLLTPAANIAAMAHLISYNRDFCKKKVGSALFPRWLASYQGRNNFKKKRFCTPGKGTYKVIQYRRKLLHRLHRLRVLKHPR